MEFREKREWHIVRLSVLFCVCVYVCVWEREKERDREKEETKSKDIELFCHENEKLKTIRMTFQSKTNLLVKKCDDRKNSVLACLHWIEIKCWSCVPWQTVKINVSKVRAAVVAQAPHSQEVMGLNSTGCTAFCLFLIFLRSFNSGVSLMGYLEELWQML